MVQQIDFSKNMTKSILNVSKMKTRHIFGYNGVYKGMNFNPSEGILT